MKYLTKFASDQPTLQHRVVKRQISAPTTGDKAICDAELSNVTCTTGVQQGLVEAALSCNNTYKNIQEAQRHANFCAKREDGQFCGSCTMELLQNQIKIYDYRRELLQSTNY